MICRTLLDGCIRLLNISKGYKNLCKNWYRPSNESKFTLKEHFSWAYAKGYFSTKSESSTITIYAVVGHTAFLSKRRSTNPVEVYQVRFWELHKETFWSVHWGLHSKHISKWYGMSLLYDIQKSGYSLVINSVSAGNEAYLNIRKFRRISDLRIL